MNKIVHFIDLISINLIETEQINVEVTCTDNTISISNEKSTCSEIKQICVQNANDRNPKRR